MANRNTAWHSSPERGNAVWIPKRVLENRHPNFIESADDVGTHSGKEGFEMRATFIAVLSLAATGIATITHAQDTGAPATSGSISLKEGFTPDPVEVEIYSGGSIDASDLGDDCVGMIADAPDFELTYAAGSSPLSLAVVSGADTSLVVNGPDGRWYCVDDSDGLDPILTWSNPESGTYDIWVGAVGDGVSSTLMITEAL